MIHRLSSNQSMSIRRDPIANRKKVRKQKILVVQALSLQYP